MQCRRLCRLRNVQPERPSLAETSPSSSSPPQITLPPTIRRAILHTARPDAIFPSTALTLPLAFRKSPLGHQALHPATHLRLERFPAHAPPPLHSNTPRVGQSGDVN